MKKRDDPKGPTQFLVHIYGPQKKSTYDLSLEIANATKMCINLHNIDPKTVLYYTTVDDDFGLLEVVMSTGCCMQHISAPATTEGAAELANRIDEMLAAHSPSAEQKAAEELLGAIRSDLGDEGGEVV